MYYTLYTPEIFITPLDQVMGLMLGEFVDDYTVRVIDVFAMPQSGTGVSVEAVDPVFQAKMLDMLKQTGRPEMVVGWYHSHPGFGCWLSGNSSPKVPLSLCDCYN